MSKASSADGQEALHSALTAIALGRGEGLESLYRLTSAKLFGICLRICRDHQAAEDVLNEVYLNVWRRAESFDAERARPMTWLCTIARNRAIDWVRRYGRALEDDSEFEDMASGDLNPEQALDRDQSRDRLLNCLNGLKVDQRDSIRTAFFEGVTYAELAKRRSVPLGTMKTWVRRGLKKLKICLNGE